MYRVFYSGFKSLRNIKVGAMLRHKIKEWVRHIASLLLTSYGHPPRFASSWWTTHLPISWLTTKMSKLLQGEDIRGPRAVTRPSTAMSSPSGHALFARPGDWMERSEIIPSTVLVKVWAVWHYSNPIATLKLEGTKPDLGIKGGFTQSTQLGNPIMPWLSSIDGAQYG